MLACGRLSSGAVGFGRGLIATCPHDSIRASRPRPVNKSVRRDPITIASRTVLYSAANTLAGGSFERCVVPGAPVGAQLAKPARRYNCHVNLVVFPVAQLALRGVAENIAVAQFHADLLRDIRKLDRVGLKHSSAGLFGNTGQEARAAGFFGR